MLIITRKRGESIIIGENSIEIKVLEMHGNQVRIGVQAPTDVSVHRKEVWLAIQKDNEERAERTQRLSGKSQDVIRRLVGGSSDEPKTDGNEGGEPPSK